MFDNEKQKDYMGMISWSRLSCGSARPHFVTEVKTSHPIRLEISTAIEELEKRNVFNLYLQFKDLYGQAGIEPATLKI